MSEPTEILESDEIPFEEDARLSNYFEDLINRETSRIFEQIHSSSKVEKIYSIMKGATRAITLHSKVKSDLFFKISLSDVPNEIEGYRIMNKYMSDHLLPVLRSNKNEGFLAIPYLTGYKNLHDIIKEKLIENDEIMEIYDDFLKEIIGLWIKTSQRRRADPSEYVDRIRSRMNKNIEVIRDMKILGKDVNFNKMLGSRLNINGETFSSHTLRDLINFAIKIIKKNPAPVVVTAHKDEHAKNILIDTKYPKHPKWYLIDMPNVSISSDWVYSIGKMRHWWIGYYYIDQLKRLSEDSIKGIKFQLDKDEVFIEYKLDDKIPDICRILDEKVREMGNWFGNWAKDKTWKTRMCVSLFTAFYGGITHHANPRHKHAIPILLGESVKSLLPLIEQYDKIMEK